MPLIEAWLKAWLYLGFMIGWSEATRPQFDISTDMGNVLVPADAEVNSTIFRLRATDQDADFPLTFDIYATATPVVRVENLPCTLYNKVCQANVILVRRLIPGRLHDFVVRVKDTKGEFNSMQATISVTNCTTPRDKIFPHIPSLVMVAEDAKPGTELDYILVRSNPWSGKPVYIELWQPKEMFKIRQRQTAATTRGVITLIGELDFETQSMFTLTLYATDAYTELGKDTRNIAGLKIVVVVKDVQDVPPIFTLAPPLTKISNTVKPGDVVLRVHAEDGDKGVPRDITYGLLPDNNPFVSFFNISETTGEIFLTRPLQELTQITYVGAPVVLKVVAEEIRKRREEPPAQSTVVEVGFLLGEPGNNPPHFENDNYMAWLDENAEPGTMVIFSDPYSTKVKDEDVGKAGVFALKLDNNNGTFEISPTVGERSANFIITVRDNHLINYELHHSLNFRITAQEVGPATNLSASVPVTILLKDINDNLPIFDEKKYEVDLSENITNGIKVIQVHATDKDSGLYGMILYTGITGAGGEAFTMDPNTGLISVAMGNKLDRERTPQLQLSVEARDEVGRGLKGVVPFIVNLLDVNDNAPIFDKPSYEFTLNADFTNFTMPAFIKATDADAEPPNNVIRYEIIHGNYDNKFYLNEVTGELVLREAVNKTRYIRQSIHVSDQREPHVSNGNKEHNFSHFNQTIETTTTVKHKKMDGNIFIKNNDARRKRAEDAAFFTLTARAYDLGVPHLSSLTRIRVLREAVMGARIVKFVMPGEHPDPEKTADTLATITGGRVIIQEIIPYPNDSEGGKKSVIIARVEHNGTGTLVDIEKIRNSLAANGVRVISGMDPTDSRTSGNTKIITNSSVTIDHKEVTTYRAENKLLTWLLILLGLLILLAIICLIICCICPGCPFYMEPRKRRIHSTETLIYRADGRPKKHLRRKRTNLEAVLSDTTKKQAWSADPIKRNWQFNRRNTKQYGLASLPGDVAHETAVDIEPKRNALSLRLQPDSPAPIHKFREFSRRPDDRMYLEDVEAQSRNYEADMDSIRRHEIARGSDISRQGLLNQQLKKANIREQHFFRDGNAEVLRLITRGEDGLKGEKGIWKMENELQERGQIRPVTLVIDQQSHLYRDGKEILLQRFIEDQEIRQDLLGSRLDIEGVSMESHQHQKELSPRREILLIPQRLEAETQHEAQRIIIDRDYERRDKKLRGQVQRPRDGGGEAMASDPKSVENSDETRDQHYTINEMELVRQNALLTRLLLEKERVGNLDGGSFLETQSLPGQVAMATQTDRTTATQTDRQLRSRSDNDESDDENRLRKKSKKKKVQPKFMNSVWIKSIPEEVPRKKESGGKRVPVSPEVLQEISDSLDEVGNSSTPRDEDEDSLDICRMVKNSESYVSKTDSTSPETDFVKRKEKGFVVNSTGKKEPSFRILEKEISTLQKKIRTFGQRKYKKVEDEDPRIKNKAEQMKNDYRKRNNLKDSKKDFEYKESKKNFEYKESKKDLEHKKGSKKDFDTKKYQREQDSKREFLFKKDLGKDERDTRKDRDSSTRESDSSRKKKSDEGRMKKSLKHQDAVQSVNSEISEPEITKGLISKKTEDKGIVKRPFKIKRQSRLQVSKGGMKNLLSRTKEVTKRKVRELRRSDDSSGEKQLIKATKIEEPKIISKNESSYKIVSARMESPPSKTTTAEKLQKDDTNVGVKEGKMIQQKDFENEKLVKCDNKGISQFQDEQFSPKKEQFSGVDKSAEQQISKKGKEHVLETSFLGRKIIDKEKWDKEDKESLKKTKDREELNKMTGKKDEVLDEVGVKKDQVMNRGTIGKDELMEKMSIKRNEKVEIKKDLEKVEIKKDMEKVADKDKMEITEKKQLLQKDRKIEIDEKDQVTQKARSEKDQLIEKATRSKDQMIQKASDKNDQFIEEATNAKDRFVREAPKKEQLLQKVTDAKDELVQKAKNEKDQWMEKATDAKDYLVKRAADDKDLLVKGATDDKDLLVQRATDARDHLVQKATDVKDHLVQKAIDDKDLLLQKATDDKDLLVQRATDARDHLVQKATDVKDHLVQKAIDDKDLLLQKATDDKDLLLQRATDDKDLLLQKATDAKDNLMYEASVKDQLVQKVTDAKEHLEQKTTDAKDHLVQKTTDAVDHLVQKTTDGKDHLVQKTTDAKDQLMLKATNAKDNLIQKTKDAKDRLVQEATSIKDHLVQEATGVKDHLAQKTTDSKDHLVQEADAKDHLVQKTIDEAHLVQKKVDADHFVQKRVDADHLVEKKVDADHLVQKKVDADHLVQKKVDADHLVQKTVDADHLVQRATNVKDHLVQEAADNKDQLAAKVTKVTEKFDKVTKVTDKIDKVPDKSDKVTKVTDKIDKVTKVADKIDKVAKVIDKSDKLTKVTDKIDRLTRVTDKSDKVTKVASKSDKVMKPGEKIDKVMKLTDETKKIEEKDKLSRTRKAKEEKEAKVTEKKGKETELSPMKSLMLETEDMRFIDDSQESTVDTSDETDSTIRQLKNSKISDKSDSDSRTLSPDQNRGSTSSSSNDDMKLDTTKSGESEETTKSDASEVTKSDESEVTKSDESEETSEELKNKQIILIDSSESSADSSRRVFKERVCESGRSTDREERVKDLKIISDQETKTTLISGHHLEEPSKPKKPLGIEKFPDSVTDEARKLSSRDECHERKMAKVLMEEQQRLQRLELLYKQFSGGTESDSDSSTESDMSSKTMLTTQPYHTPRHSPISNNQHCQKTVISKKSENKVLKNEGRKLPISRQVALDEERLEVKKQADKSQIAVTRKNVKESAQKPLKTKIVPRKEIRNSEIKKSKPLVQKIKRETNDTLVQRDKSPLIKREEKTDSKGKSKTKGEHLEKLEDEKQWKKTEIERQLKEVHQGRKERSLSPQKEVKKHTDEKIQLDQKSPQVEKTNDEERQKVRDKSHTESELQKDPKSKIDKYETDSGKDESIKAQSRYMSWYKQKREEMEKKRLERKLAEEEEQKPRWMKTAKLAKPKETIKSEGTPKLKHKVKPSINVESEQLKAIVRQGRKMRKGQTTDEDVTVQIFAPKKPPPKENVLQPISKHHLIQHSEYKYEKIPTPFYLHPPPAPYPSPQNSPEHIADQEGRKIDDDLDSGIAVSLQGGTKLRHQQLLEKKSVFDIAYSEAAPSHLRSDSSTPPS